MTAETRRVKEQDVVKGRTYEGGDGAKPRNEIREEREYNTREGK